MANTRYMQNGWTNGVISPRVLGRTDLEKYGQSAEVLQNMIVLPQGAIKRRPGTQYVADAMGPSRLISFTFSPGVAYVLELGNQTMRIFYAFNHAAQSPTGIFNPPFTCGAMIPGVTLTTPYDTSVADLWDIQVAQQGDIMYFTHPMYPIMKLMRFGVSSPVPSPTDVNWRFVQPAFTCPPTDTFDQDISIGITTMTPGGLSGTNVTFTASTGIFLPGDVGKFIVNTVDAGVAYIQSVTSTTQVNCNIMTPFATTAVIPGSLWRMRGAPSTFGSYGSMDTGNFNFESAFGVGVVSDLYSFKAYPSNGQPAPAQIDCFRNTDIGRYVNCAAGIGVITALVSPSHVTVQFLSVCEDTFTGQFGDIRIAPAVPGAWAIEDSVWFENNGYPSAICFFQNRLFIASTAQQPKTVWASETDNYENFAKGVNANDALDFTISGGLLDTIQWMAGTPVQGNLAVETDGGEYVAYGGGGPSSASASSAMTPTSINVQPNSRIGGGKIVPILADSSLLYIQRYRTKIYEFSYNIYQYSFASKDLSLYAEHLTAPGIKDAALQLLPYKIIWMVTFDGRLMGLTYDKPQDVTAWHEHRTGFADQGYQNNPNTGDQFISLTTIPNPSSIGIGEEDTDPSFTSDLVWVVVQRTRSVDGSMETVYTIELMSESLMVDCYDIYGATFGFNTATQLEFVASPVVAGRMVQGSGSFISSGLPDYAPFSASLGPPQVATTLAVGPIPLGAYQSTLKIGNHTSYGLPFQSKLVTVRPEVRGSPSVQGVLKRWSDLWVRVYSSIGMYVNGDYLSFLGREGVLPVLDASATSMEPGNFTTGIFDLGEEIAPLTTDVRINNLGYDRAGRQTIIQSDPYPLTILALFGNLNIGEQ